MRCGCPVCGIYMVQHEQGLDSGCVCPHCLHTCAMCLGTPQQPVSKQALAQHLQAIQSLDEQKILE